MELAALENTRSAFEELGASVLAISPQTLEESSRAAEDFGVEFPLLADRGNRTARDYRLVYRCPEEVRRVFLEVLGNDLEEINGDDSWMLPMPARYLIDTEGLIRWASVSPDYTERPDPQDTFEALRQLRGD